MEESRLVNYSFFKEATRYFSIGFSVGQFEFIEGRIEEEEVFFILATHRNLDITYHTVSKNEWGKIKLKYNTGATLDEIYKEVNKLGVYLS